jgi:hypothetical protein
MYRQMDLSSHTSRPPKGLLAAWNQNSIDHISAQPCVHRLDEFLIKEWPKSTMRLISTLPLDQEQMLVACPESGSRSFLGWRDCHAHLNFNVSFPITADKHFVNHPQTTNGTYPVGPFCLCQLRYGRGGRHGPLSVIVIPISDRGIAGGDGRCI